MRGKRALRSTGGASGFTLMKWLPDALRNSFTINVTANSFKLRLVKSTGHMVCVIRITAGYRYFTQCLGLPKPRATALGVYCVQTSRELCIDHMHMHIYIFNSH